MPLSEKDSKPQILRTKRCGARSASLGVLILVMALFGKAVAEPDATTGAASAAIHRLLSEPENLRPSAIKSLFDELPPEQVIAQLNSELSRNRPGVSAALTEAAGASLQSRDEVEASALAIADFIDSGANVHTGLPFSVTLEGRLKAAPTLRIAALDWLGDADPVLASEYATQILETTSDSGEAALALRNLGRQTSPGADSHFSKAAREFVTDPRWIAEPTAAYFEGFDALVYSGTYDDLEVLLQVAEQNERLRRFCAMIVDAMISRDPVSLLRNLLEQADRWSAFSEHRPYWFARPYFGTGGYDALVTEYLESDDIALEEKELFLDAFPHFGRFTAPRLLTKDRLLSRAEMIEQVESSREYLRILQTKKNALAPVVLRLLSEAEQRLP